MKKKIVAALLVSVMAICAFTGCGKQIEGDGKVQAAMADAGNGQEDNAAPESKEEEEESPEITKEPETGSPEDASNVPDSEEEDASMPESAADSAEDAATDGEEAGLDSEDGLADNSEGANSGANEEESPVVESGNSQATPTEDGNSGGTVSEDSEEKEGAVTPQGEPQPAQSKGEKAGYTIEDIDVTTMYATADGGLNIRDLPESSGKKLGSVAWGTGLTVTGRCKETGWYRVLYNNNGTEITAYASKTYLSATKPVRVTAATNESASTESNTGGSSGSGTSDGSGSYTAQMWVTERGVDKLIDVTNFSNIPESHPAYSGNGLAKEFIDYLNQQRVANGLSAIVWDDSLAQLALDRAVAISTDFNHTAEASRIGAGECIQGYINDSLSGWFTNWFNSPGHRAALMDPGADSAACAFYEVDGYYWVVYLDRHHAVSTIADLVDDTAAQEGISYQEAKQELLENGTIVQVGDNAYTSASEADDWSVVTEDDLDPEVLENLKALGWF